MGEAPVQRQRSVAIDMAALLLLTPTHARRLLHFLSRDGIELAVYTGIERQQTKRLLRDLRLLPYLDDIVSYTAAVPVPPPDALWINEPAPRYSTIAAATIRADRIVPYADVSVDGRDRLKVAESMVPQIEETHLHG